MLDAKAVEAMFTRGDGGYMCARWGRPIAPVVFGVEIGRASCRERVFVHV